MKTEKDLSVYLKEILQAAKYIQQYTQELTFEQFLEDPKTTQAVIMNMFIIGENASKLLKTHQEFTKETSDLKWEGMRGMRNRIAHGYFEMNMAVVWETSVQSIPQIINKISFLVEKLQEPPEPEMSM